MRQSIRSVSPILPTKFKELRVMKAFRLISVMFVPLFLIVSASGQVRLTTSGASTTSNRATPPAGNNLAVVDSSAFMDEKAGIGRVVAAMKALSVRFEPVQKEVQGLRDRLTAVQNQMQKTPTLTPDSLAKLQEQADQLERDIKRKSEDGQKNYDREFAATLDPLQAEIGTALTAYAATKGILLIIDVSRVPVIYAHESIDITKDFIAEYNRTHPLGTAPAKP
jgi:Skp family chaperone for outer membrane proteins